MDPDFDPSFGDFCIVCDRAIVPAKEKATEAVKTVETKQKKKAAGGTIRVKNADGTVMIRNANGTKTTRPALRRNPSSANRLALAAANNNAAAKLQPLMRSKTTGTDVDLSIESKNGSGSSGAVADSPESQTLRTPSTPGAHEPFVSTIYCSRSCAQSDNDRARRISFNLGSPGLHLVTSGLPISGSSKSPYALPSPLCISGSDTSSNADPSSAEPAASSVPNSMGFFQYGREAPDAAWNEINRQRRSSMHPAIRPVGMSREPSQASQFSVMQSSDSLNSLWVDQEPVARSVSGRGALRLAQEASAPAAIPARPAPRSTLSQTSLAASPRPATIPAEFGSAPDHTFDLWHSFNNSFAKRDATGTSTSRGFVHPNAGTTPTTSPPLATSRRPSYSLHRAGGTIRANKSHTNVTWDSFGQEELRAKQRRASIKANAHSELPGRSLVEAHGTTPKPSIEVGKNGCEIKYYLPQSLNSRASLAAASGSPRPIDRRRSSYRSVNSVRSDSSASETEADHSPRVNAHPGALSIPRPQLSSSYSSSSRTPTGMLPPTILPSRQPSHAQLQAQAGQMPDLAALRVGSGGCAPYAQASRSPAHTAGSTTPSSSVPRSTWNWSEFERQGGKTYEVPEGLKAHAGKSGLFYFQ